MMSSDESLKFIRSRNNAFDDVMRKMNMFFKNNVIKPITVESIGEEAIDDGDPLQELYTMFYNNAPGKLLYGPQKNYLFMHYAHRNEKYHFPQFGKFQDRIVFVSHWLNISYQMMLQLLQLLFNLLMFLFLK